MKLSLEIHHYHHYPELENMSQQLDDIRREVAEAKDVASSAVTLILGLKSRIDALLASELELADLKAQLAGLSQDLSDSTDALAAAVATDGGSEPEAPAEPETPAEPEAPTGDAESQPGDDGEGEGEGGGAGDTAFPGEGDDEDPAVRTSDKQQKAPIS